MPRGLGHRAYLTVLLEKKGIVCCTLPQLFVREGHAGRLCLQCTSLPGTCATSWGTPNDQAPLLMPGAHNEPSHASRMCDRLELMLGYCSASSVPDTLIHGASSFACCPHASCGPPASWREGRGRAEASGVAITGVLTVAA